MDRIVDTLRSGAPILAVDPGGACPPLAPFLARAGATLFIDCERKAICVSAVPGLVAASRAAGGTTMLRAENVAPEILTRYLDCGIDALVIPRVESAAAADAIVATARDQALGAKRTAIIVQIESRAGVAAACAIARAEGLDGVLLGPNDLAVSMGHPGAPDHPQVQDALKEVTQILNAARMPFGLPVTPTTLPGWAARGARLFYIAAADFVASALHPYAEAARAHC